MIFEPYKGARIGEWRKRHNQEFDQSSGVQKRGCNEGKQRRLQRQMKELIIVGQWDGWS